MLSDTSALVSKVPSKREEAATGVMKRCFSEADVLAFRVALTAKLKQRVQKA
jgi:hypothetical protein